VLVNGASGGVGTYAVQIAKALGAEVIGVCSTGNVGMVRSIGADDVIDYTAKDFTAGDTRYDAIIDTIGNHPLRRVRRVLEPTGTLVSVGAPMGNWIGPIVHLAKVALASRFGKPTMRSMLATANSADLETLARLMEEGKVRSVIDRTYPLEQTAEAMRYLEAGHVPGKVVVTI
jgi:NADPH:quinone reductase-like Zn-dependent oxidoreductase